jgi:hypothetical protein
MICPHPILPPASLTSHHHAKGLSFFLLEASSLLAEDRLNFFFLTTRCRMQKFAVAISPFRSSTLWIGHPSSSGDNMQFKQSKQTSIVFLSTLFDVDSGKEMRESWLLLRFYLDRSVPMIGVVGVGCLVTVLLAGLAATSTRLRTHPLPHLIKAAPWAAFFGTQGLRPEASSVAQREREREQRGRAASCDLRASLRLVKL